MIITIIVIVIINNIIFIIIIIIFLYRLYATKVMIGCVESELRAMRNGLHDVIPSELLSSLTPEVSTTIVYIDFVFTA